MSLYDGWQAMMQDTETPEFAEFWNTYIATEKEAYRKILSDTAVIFSGKASELAETFGMDERIFAGFLDGINDSLTERIDVPSVEADTEITLSIDVYADGRSQAKIVAEQAFNDILHNPTTPRSLNALSVCGGNVKEVKEVEISCI